MTLRSTISLLALALAGTAPTIDAAPPLDEGVDSLRALGAYEAALARASALDPAEAWRDHERTLVIGWLREILAGDASRRAGLARVDSMRMEILRSGQAGTLQGSDPVLDAEIAGRVDLLGVDHPDVLRSRLAATSVRVVEGRMPSFDDVTALADAVAIAYGDDHPLTADALDVRGAVEQHRAHFDAAEASYLAALAIRETVPEDPDGLAETVGHLGALASLQGHFDDAEERLRRALTIRRDTNGPGHPFTAIAQNNLATVLLQKGDYAAAGPLFRACLARFRELFGEDHMAVAGTTSNLAELRKLQGDYAGSEEMYLEALELVPRVLGPDHLHVGTVKHNFAGLRKLQHRYDEALALHESALATFETALGPDHPQVATAKNNVGFLYLVKGEPANAEPWLREALAARERLLGPEHPETAGTLFNLGRSLHDQGRIADGRVALVRALELRDRALAASHPHVVTNVVRIARADALLGDADAARAGLIEASERYETARLRAGTGIERATFLEPPYDALAAAHAAAGDGASAWIAAERGRARVLLDLLSVSGDTPITDAEATRRSALLAEVDELESKLSVLVRADVDPPDPPPSREDDGPYRPGGELARGPLEQRLLGVESELRALQRELEERHGAALGRPATPEEVAGHLDPGTRLVGWVEASGSDGAFDDWVYVLDPTGEVSWRRLPAGSGARRAELATAFRLGLAEGATATFGPSPDDGVREQGAELHALVLGPARDLLAGADHLVVVPSGAMQGIPVEALVEPGGHFVGEARAVTYVPSASLLPRLDTGVDPVAGSHRPALLVGDPPFGDGVPGSLRTSRSALSRSAVPLDRLPRLPRSRDEILAVAGLYDRSLVLVGDDASEPRMSALAASDSLRGFGTVHLATHALVNHERPEGSALVLSQAGLPDPLDAAIAGRPIVDGVITAGEVTARWRLDADLVVLSACGTGLGTRAHGEGFVGLAHAFFRAGARNLVVSLWEVDDAATARLMSRVHESRTGHYSGPRGGHPAGARLSVVDALAEAKAWLRDLEEDGGYRPYAHPAIWAAFVAMGPGR